MKTAHDPRHKRREAIIKKLYSFSFGQEKVDKIIKKIVGRLDEIDSLIKKSAPEWPIEKLNKVDLSILRLGVYELIKREVPEKVVIDEAVELGKEYGSVNTPKFVNGVLGTILDNLKKGNND
jgi:N utilization substance protein B